MQVKLNALLLRLIDNLYLFGGADSARVYDNLGSVFIVLNVAHNGNCTALFEVIEHGGLAN